MILLHRTVRTRGKEPKYTTGRSADFFFGYFKVWALERMDREKVQVTYIWFLVDLIAFYRAAERYVDVSPQERARRRERGWGNEEAMSYFPFI